MTRTEVDRAIIEGAIELLSAMHRTGGAHTLLILARPADARAARCAVAVLDACAGDVADALAVLQEHAPGRSQEARP